MTHQIKDSLVPNENDSKSYSITRFSSNRPFRFSQYFDPPFIFFTACWKRHVARYKIVNNELVLDHLRVFKETNDAPIINGVKPELVKSFESEIPVYNNLRMKMDYTGLILVESGHVNLGLGLTFRDVQVKKIIEYDFENGILQKTEDLSWLMKQFRQEILNYGKKHIETHEMLNNILGHSVRNKKNIAKAEKTISDAKKIVLSGNLAELSRSLNQMLFSNFKLKDREFCEEINQRIYKNYGRPGWDW